MTPGRKRAIELLELQRAVVLEASKRLDSWERLCELEASVGILRARDHAAQVLSESIRVLDLADRAAFPNDGTSH